jgi:hypothetical protein
MAVGHRTEKTRWTKYQLGLHQQDWATETPDWYTPVSAVDPLDEETAISSGPQPSHSDLNCTEPERFRAVADLVALRCADYFEQVVLLPGFLLAAVLEVAGQVDRWVVSHWALVSRIVSNFGKESMSLVPSVPQPPCSQAAYD